MIDGCGRKTGGRCRPWKCEMHCARRPPPQQCESGNTVDLDFASSIVDISHPEAGGLTGRFSGCLLRIVVRSAGLRPRTEAERKHISHPLWTFPLEALYDVVHEKTGTQSGEILVRAPAHIEHHSDAESDAQQLDADRRPKAHSFEKQRHIDRRDECRIEQLDRADYAREK